jgi:hypothetical protein
MKLIYISSPCATELADFQIPENALIITDSVEIQNQAEFENREGYVSKKIDSPLSMRHSNLPGRNPALYLIGPKYLIEGVKMGNDMVRNCEILGLLESIPHGHSLNQIINHFFHYINEYIWVDNFIHALHRKRILNIQGRRSMSFQALEVCKFA